MLFLATIMGEREWEQGLREEGKLRIYNGAQGGKDPEQTRSEG